MNFQKIKQFFGVFHSVLVWSRRCAPPHSSKIRKPRPIRVKYPVFLIFCFNKQMLFTKYSDLYFHIFGSFHSMTYLKTFSYNCVWITNFIEFKILQSLHYNSQAKLYKIFWWFPENLKKKNLMSGRLFLSMMLPSTKKNYFFQ